MLQFSNYSSFEGVPYCKPHYDQLFKMTGSLEKSFEGTLQVTLLFFFFNIHRIFSDLKAKWIFFFDIGAPRTAKAERSINHEVLQ